jgi:hypothetical protein
VRVTGNVNKSSIRADLLRRVPRESFQKDNAALDEQGVKESWQAKGDSGRKHWVKERPAVARLNNKKASGKPCAE